MSTNDNNHTINSTNSDLYEDLQNFLMSRSTSEGNTNTNDLPSSLPPSIQRELSSGDFSLGGMDMTQFLQDPAFANLMQNLSPIPNLEISEGTILPKATISPPTNTFTTTATTTTSTSNSKKRKAPSTKEEKNEILDDSDYSDENDDLEDGKSQRVDNKTRNLRWDLATFYCTGNRKVVPDKASRGAKGCKRRIRLTAQQKSQASHSLRMKKSEFREHLLLYKRLSTPKSDQAEKDEGINLEKCFQSIQNDESTAGYEQIDKRRKQKESKFWLEYTEETPYIVEATNGMTKNITFQESYICPKFDDMKKVSAMDTGIYHHFYFQKLRIILSDIQCKDSIDPEKRRRYEKFMEKYFPEGEGEEEEKNNFFPYVYDLEQKLKEQNPFYPIEPITHPRYPNDSTRSLGNYGLPIALFIEYDVEKPELKSKRKFNGTYGRYVRWKNEAGNAYRKHKRPVEYDSWDNVYYYNANGRISQNRLHQEKIIVSEKRGKLIKNNDHSVCRNYAVNNSKLLIPQYLLTKNKHVVRNDSESSNGSHYEANHVDSGNIASRRLDTTSSSESNNSEIKNQRHKVSFAHYKLNPALYSVKDGLTVYSISSLMVPPCLMGKLDFQTIWDHSFYSTSYCPRYTMASDEFLSHFASDREARDAVSYFTHATVNDTEAVTRKDYMNFMHWWSNFAPHNSYKNLAQLYHSFKVQGLFFFFHENADKLNRLDEVGLCCLRPNSKEPTGITIEIRGHSAIEKAKFKVNFLDDGSVEYQTDNNNTPYQSFDILLDDLRKALGLEKLVPFNPHFHQPKSSSIYVRYPEMSSSKNRIFKLPSSLPLETSILLRDTTKIPSFIQSSGPEFSMPKQPHEMERNTTTSLTSNPPAKSLTEILTNEGENTLIKVPPLAKSLTEVLTNQGENTLINNLQVPENIFESPHPCESQMTPGAKSNEGDSGGLLSRSSSLRSDDDNHVFRHPMNFKEDEVNDEFELPELAREDSAFLTSGLDASDIQDFF